MHLLPLRQNCNPATGSAGCHCPQLRPLTASATSPPAAIAAFAVPPASVPSATASSDAMRFSGVLATGSGPIPMAEAPREALLAFRLQKQFAVR